MAVHANADGGKARVVAEVLSLDGKRFVRVDESISLDETCMNRSVDLGRRLMEMGGKELVEEAVKAFGAR